MGSRSSDQLGIGRVERHQESVAAALWRAVEGANEGPPRKPAASPGLRRQARLAGSAGRHRGGLGCLLQAAIRDAWRAMSNGVYTIPSFVAHLTQMMMAMPMAEHAALEAAAVIVETEARRGLGTHDYHSPPPPPSTILSKATRARPGPGTREN